MALNDINSDEIDKQVYLPAISSTQHSNDEYRLFLPTTKQEILAKPPPVIISKKQLMRVYRFLVMETRFEHKAAAWIIELCHKENDELNQLIKQCGPIIFGYAFTLYQSQLPLSQILLQKNLEKIFENPQIFLNLAQKAQILGILKRILSMFNNDQNNFDILPRSTFLLPIPFVELPEKKQTQSLLDFFSISIASNDNTNDDTTQQDDENDSPLSSSSGCSRFMVDEAHFATLLNKIRQNYPTVTT